MKQHELCFACASFALTPAPPAVCRPYWIPLTWNRNLTSWHFRSGYGGGWLETTYREHAPGACVASVCTNIKAAGSGMHTNADCNCWPRMMVLKPSA